MNSRLQLRSRIQASKSTQLVRQGCFFLPIFSCNFDEPSELQFFTGLLFYAYVETHQVNRLVFENTKGVQPLVTKGVRPLVTVKDQYSHLVYPIICIGKQTGHLRCKRIMKANTSLLHKFVCFQMPNKRLQAWSLLIIEWEIPSFSKTMLLQFRESPFSLCFILSKALHCQVTK